MESVARLRLPDDRYFGKKKHKISLNSMDHALHCKFSLVFGTFAIDEELIDSSKGLEGHRIVEMKRSRMKATASADVVRNIQRKCQIGLRT